MQLESIIETLRRDRTKLDEVISSLQQLVPEARPFLRRKRGRKFMDEAGRLEVSARMRKYWASQRAARAEKTLSQGAA